MSKSLKDIISSLKVAQLGGTITIYCKQTAVVVEKDLVKKAIRSGEAYVHDGVREFYEWEPHYDTTKSGGDCYTWHRDGNRVRCSLVRHVVEKDGTLTQTTVRIAWKKFIDL